MRFTSKTRSFLQKAGISALLLAILTTRIHAQISIEPMGVYLSPQQPASTITLVNRGLQATEVMLEIGYGYPRTQNGQTLFYRPDSIPSDAPAATSWIRATPRRTVLAPGQQQTVRILANPPSNLPPGEYWARIFVTPVHEAQNPTQGSSITLQSVSPVAVTYRQGPCTTGIQITHASALLHKDIIQTEFDLVRQGNAAYLGLLRLGVRDEQGKILATTEIPVAVYEHLQHRTNFQLPANVDPARIRSLFYEIATTRTDLPTGAALPFPTVRGTITTIEQ